MKNLKSLLNQLVQFVHRFWRTLLLIIIVSLATLIVSSAISIWLSRFHNLYFPSLGAIRVIGVEAYGGNINTTQNGNPFIDWGTVYLGNSVNRSFYIKSISNELIILQLMISNVTFQNSNGKNVTEDPPIENPLLLTWNYNGTPLNPKEEIFVTVTLMISSDQKFIDYVINNDVKQFFFDIIIKPAEQ